MPKLKNCVCCGNKDLISVVYFGKQPLANEFHDNSKKLKKYPLELMECSVCTHNQLSYSVKPEVLFDNYLYVSGTSQTLLNHFKWMVEYVETFVKPGAILEIASNDGSQLKLFQDNKWFTTGVDPAQNISSAVGKHTAYWDKKLAKLINKTRQHDVVLAQNVLGHVPNPRQFLKAIHFVLSKNGYVFLQTSQADMLKNGEYDTIYHEHISYFNINSFNYLANECGFEIVEYRKVPIHGNSHLFVLQSKNHNRHTFLASAVQSAKNLTEKVDYYKEEGYVVAGLGAAAKGNTVLNAVNAKLDFIIDENPLKQGLFTPGMNIPVVGMDHLKNFKDDIVFVILAWNMADEMKRKIRNIRGERDMFI